MGCLGEMIIGLLGGFLSEVFADLSTSLMGRIMLCALCGETGSEFMIRYADETGGSKGLLRESGRRKLMRVVLGILLFVFVIGFIFWIIVLLASYAKDFDWVRKNGGWILAGIAGLFLAILFGSRILVSRKMRGTAVPDRRLPECFVIPGYRSKSAIELCDAFGGIAAFFFILLAVCCLAGGHGQDVLAVLAVLLFLVSALLFYNAHANRGEHVTLVILTRKGILGPDNLLLPWSEVPDIQETKGVLAFQSGKGGDTREPMTVSLGQSVYMPEIILYKIRQYQKAGMDSTDRPSKKKAAKR